jgi:hypothetical protein
MMALRLLGSVFGQGNAVGSQLLFQHLDAGCSVAFVAVDDCSLRLEIRPETAVATARAGVSQRQIRKLSAVGCIIALGEKRARKTSPGEERHKRSRHGFADQLSSAA